MVDDNSLALSQLREENLRLHMMIASFESSRSWRMTAPFRKYAAFLRSYHLLPEISQKLMRGLLSTYEWEEETSIHASVTPRIAVIAHIYYLDLVAEIADAIQRCGPDTSVIVTYVDPAILPNITDILIDVFRMWSTFWLKIVGGICGPSFRLLLQSPLTILTRF